MDMPHESPDSCQPGEPATTPTVPEDIARDDPQVAALLGFAPVHRRTRRSDGWPPDLQRIFVAALATLGNVDRAAHTISRTASGAYKVRSSAGAEEFAQSWDKALALHHVRNPKPARVGRPSRGELLADHRAGRLADAEAMAEQAMEEPGDPQAEQRAYEEVFDRILVKYLVKMKQERTARLEGRIVEADFFARQLTYIEISLDVGGGAGELLDRLKRRDVDGLGIVATPMSVLLDGERRKYWAEKDEPERPPLGELGEHDDEFATGPAYRRDRDGDQDEWRIRETENAALAAEAQAAWEDKARKDAEEWARREAPGELPPAHRQRVEGKDARP